MLGAEEESANGGKDVEFPLGGEHVGASWQEKECMCWISDGRRGIMKPETLCVMQRNVAEADCQSIAEVVAWWVVGGRRRR